MVQGQLVSRGRALRRHFLAVLLPVQVWVAASGVSAQERVSPEVFLDFALGKTLTFDTFPGGELVGVEEYLRRNLSVWRDRSGTCVYGQITVENDQICFLYDNDEDGVPICWITFLEGERWFVLSTNGRRSEIQQITRVTEDGLDCPENPGV